VTAIKPAEVDRFLARPDPAVRVVLIYGPDDGLVAERTAAFAKTVTGGSGDPFSLTRLDSGEIADDPARLADEAHAIPMFGGQKAIVVRHSGNRQIQGPVGELIDNPPTDSWVVIAAGEMRADAPLRKLCESRKEAAAIPCYSDSGRDLDRIIQEETALAKLSISDEARDLLKSLLGADRMASRSEVSKLCLYAADDRRIETDHVREIVGDTSAFATDEAVDAAALGDTENFDRAFRRLLASGTPGFVVAGAALRHFGFLHRARAAFDEGTPAKSLVSRARPPIFFQRQPKVERQIALWPMGRIERNLALLDQAIVDSRLRGAISDDVIGQALSLIAASGAALRRSAR